VGRNTRSLLTEFGVTTISTPW